MNTARRASIEQALQDLLASLGTHPQAHLITQALRRIIQMSETTDLERLDWKILNRTLEDMHRAWHAFAPYQCRRKITLFGSARTPPGSEIYQHALEFSRRIAEAGFMVMTGAGGGVMEAGNAGAGTEHSFGLNIDLPFEQSANPFIRDDQKLVDFKYFFTRKLFFLKETDALVLFPGGLGTQDECFECLTLIQTGKTTPLPVVLIDAPGGDYWQQWDQYIRSQLLGRDFISPDDVNLYSVTDDIDVACRHISHFYRIYHSSRYVGSDLVIRLNQELSDAWLERLNEEFTDIIQTGRIIKSAALPVEQKDETYLLPRLVMAFDRHHFGRLRQLIDAINDYEYEHPTKDEPAIDNTIDPALRLNASQAGGSPVVE